MTTPHVTKEQADKLYKFGLGSLSAPTIAEATQWLREVKGLHVYAEPIWNNKSCWDGVVIYMPLFRKILTDNFPTHDLAISAGITKALELCEKEGGNE